MDVTTVLLFGLSFGACVIAIVNTFSTRRLIRRTGEGFARSGADISNIEAEINRLTDVIKVQNQVTQKLLIDVARIKMEHKKKHGKLK